MLPCKSSYTKQELGVFYKDTADFPTLSQLLQSLELIVTFDNKEFIIPCKVPESATNAIFKNGRTIFCVDGKSMLSPTVFATVQARVLKAMGSKEDQPIMTKGSIQFMHQSVAFAKEGEEEGQDAINFAVAYKDKDQETCFRDLEDITAIIVTTLYSMSPGTTVTTGRYFVTFDIHYTELTFC